MSVFSFPANLRIIIFWQFKVFFSAQFKQGSLVFNFLLTHRQRSFAHIQLCSSHTKKMLQYYQVKFFTMFPWAEDKFYITYIMLVEWSFINSPSYLPLPRDSKIRSTVFRVKLPLVKPLKSGVILLSSLAQKTQQTNLTAFFYTLSVWCRTSNKEVVNTIFEVVFRKRTGRSFSTPISRKG